MKEKCVLAYSGGLDTSAIIPWLTENYHYEVIAYCCNVGNLPPESDLRDRALELGASEFIYEDAQDEFVSDYVYPMLRAGATYYDDYLLGTAIARPLIALKVANFAKSINAKAIAHGATGKGNDHLRFESAWAYLCPDIAVIAPWKMWSYRSREELMSFLKTKNYLWGDGKKTFSVDLNTFHRSCEGGDLENIEAPVLAENVCDWISFNSQLSPTILNLELNGGKIIKINDQAMTPKNIIQNLNAIGSSYGIGICDIVEERINGIKSRGFYETPGGTISHMAIKTLKQICFSRDLYQTSQQLADQYGQLIYDGKWFSDTRIALDQFFVAASEKLSGIISLRLQVGSVQVNTRQSSFSLYNPAVVSFESDSLDIHKAALGYTRIMTLSSLLQGQRHLVNK